MSISAVNCTPIKPQVSFGMAEGADDARKIIALSNDLNDSFVKKDDEGNNIKGPLALGVSILGAAASMFALGVGGSKAAIAGAKKLNTKFPALKDTVVKNGKKAVDYVAKKMPKVPVKLTEKISPKVKNFVSQNTVKAKTFGTGLVEKYGAEKLFTVGTGVLTAAALAPDIVKADANGDGIADIADKRINAYSSALKSVGIFEEIVNVLV